MHQLIQLSQLFVINSNFLFSYITDVWDDMFDPYHNAVNDYYLVPTSLAGSWNVRNYFYLVLVIPFQGLACGTVVFNW